MIGKTSQGIGRLIILALLITCNPAAVADDYVEYQATSGRTVLFELFFDDSEFGYDASQNDQTHRFVCNRDQVRLQGERVLGDGRELINGLGFEIGPKFAFEEITDIEVSKDQGFTTLTFYTRSTGDRQYGSKRRGYIVEPFDPINIAEDQFVRGTIFSVGGDIEIYGEVNGDAIALFGDVFVGPDAVVRGNVVAMEGRIDLAGDASVYGEVVSGTDSRLGRQHRHNRFRNSYIDMLEFEQSFTYYNRVDGLTLGVGNRFSDPDSVLPTIWTGGGYAFESERWRYKLGLEQTLLRRPGIALGAEVFRHLASGDDWIISTDENTAFMLIAGEDFKDYYEAEGVRAYLRVAPISDLVFETGYTYEETKWLEAERDLWTVSLSGRDKLRSHFSSVPLAARQAGAQEIDTSVTANLYARIDYDTRILDDPFFYSSWTVEGQVQWSNPDWESSFDNTRYRLGITRYQRLNRRLMAIFRATYGGSEGYLPMHQRYYLGGIGTLRGYEHKELSGEYFWMANAEYRIAFPRSDLAASVLWDVGQVAETGDFAGSDVKHSLGMAVYLGSDLKLGVAKRLDRSHDDKLQFYARFAYGL